ncbi:MAG TPA: zinc ribbon domain-containing protein [Steroidobacteraceae bacterium]|nr:zinc ribbon domain-containing protein [Steroidobacteraceae bacterium]
MPFYEYECASCKFYTEVMQKISDTPLKKCPSCGKSTLKKLISAPVFRLKGGGWYETDFKSDKESKRNLAGGDDGPDAKARETPPPADAKAGDAQSGNGQSGSSKAGDSKSDSKPAEKASASDSGASGVASRSASKSAAGKPAKAGAKPAARAPARKPAPKAKAKTKASKRRGR